MRSLATHALLGMVLAAGLTLPARAQLNLPCDEFYRDASGAWNAAAPVTVDTRIGLLDIMPGHPVGIAVAGLLDARCR